MPVRQKVRNPKCWAAAIGKCTPERGCEQGCPHYGPARAEMGNGPLISLAELTRGRGEGRKVEHAALASA